MLLLGPDCTVLLLDWSSNEHILINADWYCRESLYINIRWWLNTFTVYKMTGREKALLLHRLILLAAKENIFTSIVQLNSYNGGQAKHYNQQGFWHHSNWNPQDRLTCFDLLILQLSVCLSLFLFVQQLDTVPTLRCIIIVLWLW